MAGHLLTLKDWRLTTAHILYHLPDYPRFLQSFVWQDYDVAPRFPQLERFLQFWTDTLDGAVHSVTVAQAGPERAHRWRYADGEFTLH